MIPVRCSGCKRIVAWQEDGPSALRRSIHCSKLCASDVPAFPTMDREDLWTLLVARGTSVSAVADRWGVARSVVYRVLRKTPTAV